LRSAIGKEASSADYQNTTEPHDRGAILVAAVFDASLECTRAAVPTLSGWLPEAQGQKGWLDCTLFPCTPSPCRKPWFQFGNPRPKKNGRSRYWLDLL